MKFKIENGILRECISPNVNVTIPDGVTVIDREAFCERSKIKKVILPSSLRVIGDRAFYKCSNLIMIDFSAQVRTIDQNAFEACESLEKIVLPEGIVDIYRHAFTWCPKLKQVTGSKKVFMRIESQLSEAFKPDVEYVLDDGTCIGKLEELKKAVKAWNESQPLSDADKALVEKTSKLVDLKKVAADVRKRTNSRNLIPVRYANQEAYVPTQIIQYIIYRYSSMPHNDLNGIVLDKHADYFASLLDHESLMEALRISASPVIFKDIHEVDWRYRFWDQYWVLACGDDRDGDDGYRTDCKTENLELLLPYCRYANEDEIEELIKLCENWNMKYENRHLFDNRPRMYAGLALALLLSNTNAAKRYLEKYTTKKYFTKDQLLAKHKRLHG